MYVLVVYESMFGNTAAVARAVADGLAGGGPTGGDPAGQQVRVRVAEVNTRPEATAADAVVVGAPTHAFGMSRPATRADAARQGAQAPVELGLREWLATLRRPGLTVAAFDTRIANPLVPGSAAKKAARSLRRAGCRLLTPAESFLVTGTKGPLRDGELERARTWGADLATRMVTPAPPCGG